MRTNQILFNLFAMSTMKEKQTFLSFQTSNLMLFLSNNLQKTKKKRPYIWSCPSLVRRKFHAFF